jgi:Fe-S cluster biogenesis protein NfuA
MEEGNRDARGAVRAVIEDVIAPLVAVDGGAVTFVSHERGRVALRFGQACSGCPGQRLTIEQVILPALRVVDDSIVAVDPITDL